MRHAVQIQTEVEAQEKAKNGLSFDFLQECALMMESLAVSIREAAWRGSAQSVVVHLKQMRLALLAAIEEGRKLTP